MASNQGNEPTSIDRIALELFNVKTFKENQREIIKSILEKRDTIAILPTGGGKSLTYQIPAFMFKGLTLVISPLQSLMLDQCLRLKSLGITGSDYLSSNRNPDENENVLKNLNELNILYITPERLENKKFLSALAENQIVIDLIAVDEAHCVSLWGNTFRPAYLNIKTFSESHPSAVIAAFSATATPQILADISKSLGLRKPTIIKKSVKRENISLKIRYSLDKTAYLLENLNKNLPSIIYTSSRWTCERLSYLLQSHGYSAIPYHAGMPSEERNKHQDLFLSGKVSVIVATSAFGMGIDKQNIRKIWHYGLPFEIEEYVQEIGRAGRDGLPASAEMIIGMDDFADNLKIVREGSPKWSTVRKWINSGKLTGSEERILTRILDSFALTDKAELLKLKKEYLKRQSIAIQKAELMIDFAINSGCQSGFIQRYFEEAYEDCNHCDNCQNSKQQTLTLPQIKIVSALPVNKRKLRLEELRAIVLGLHQKHYLSEAYRSLQGLPLADFYNNIYSLFAANRMKPDRTGLMAGITNEFRDSVKGRIR